MNHSFMTRRELVGLAIVVAVLVVLSVACNAVMLVVLDDEELRKMVALPMIFATLFGWSGGAMLQFLLVDLQNYGDDH